MRETIAWYRVGVMAFGLFAPLVQAAARTQEFGSGMGMGESAILSFVEVQRELKLTKEQNEMIVSIQREEVRRLFEKMRNFPREEQSKQAWNVRKEVSEAADRSLEGVLSAGQMNRYKQITLQRRGALAFGEPEVQKRLKLNSDQLQKAKQIFEETKSKMHKVFREAVQAGRVADAGVISVGRIINESTELIIPLLTDEQKRTWREMIGKPFEIQSTRPNP